MIPAHTIQITDEEVAVLCEALAFYASEYDPDLAGSDWPAANRSVRVAEELVRRLPVAIAPLSVAA